MPPSVRHCFMIVKNTSLPVNIETLEETEQEGLYTSYMQGEESVRRMGNCQGPCKRWDLLSFVSRTFHVQWSLGLPRTAFFQPFSSAIFSPDSYFKQSSKTLFFSSTNLPTHPPFSTSVVEEKLVWIRFSCFHKKNPHMTVCSGILILLVRCSVTLIAHWSGGRIFVFNPEIFEFVFLLFSKLFLK